MTKDEVLERIHELAAEAWSLYKEVEPSAWAMTLDVFESSGHTRYDIYTFDNDKGEFIDKVTDRIIKEANQWTS